MQIALYQPASVAIGFSSPIIGSGATLAGSCNTPWKFPRKLPPKVSSQVFFRVIYAGFMASRVAPNLGTLPAAYHVIMKWPCFFVVLLMTTTLALGDDWPQWRGPTHNGISAESSNHPAGWPPKRLWSRSVGHGCTSPIIVDGKLYVTGWTGRPDWRNNPRGEDSLYCFDAASGQQLWRTTYPSRYQGRHRTGDERQYGGPSATPTYDTKTNLLYTLGIDGDLICWNANAKGERVWETNLYDTYQSRQRPPSSKGQRDFGFTAAPLLVGDQLIVQVGAPGATFIAFDKRTGKEKWQSQYSRPAGHTAGIVPLRVAGQPALASLALFDVVVFDHTGRTLATAPWVTDFSTNIPTPAAHDNLLAVTTGYNQRKTALFRIGEKALAEVWTARQHAAVGSPVMYKDRVFTVGNPLEATRQDTGERIFRGGRFDHGSVLITAADHRAITFGRGSVVLVDAMANDYQELSRLDNIVRGTCYPHPALADGLLAVKDKDGSLVCLSIRTHTDEPEKPKPIAAPVVGKTIFTWPTDAPLTPRGSARTEGNVMHLDGGALIAGAAIDSALLAACRATGELTLEARFTTASLDQRGPARIISFSADAYKRNFTLGQEGDQLILRLRTTHTDDNGMNPQTVLARLAVGRSHHVRITYRDGSLRCTLDSKEVSNSDKVRGDFSNWEAHHLIFGDEWQDARPWRGTIEQITLHSAATSE